MVVVKVEEYSLTAPPQKGLVPHPVRPRRSRTAPMPVLLALYVVPIGLGRAHPGCSMKHSQTCTRPARRHFSPTSLPAVSTCSVLFCQILKEVAGLLLQCAVFSVQCAVCSVQCSVCSVQCSVFSVQRSVCSVQCSVCDVQCAVCGVQCAVLLPSAGPYIPHSTKLH